MTLPRVSQADPAARNHFVYRLFNAAGQLVYVGCTSRPTARWHEHQAVHDWTADVAYVRMQGPFTYVVGRAKERQALRSEQPLHGNTPARQSLKQRRASVARRLMDRLMREGLSFGEALHRSLAIADVEVPA